ncbi:MAG: SH3 domain-containing protein [Chloroflexi bacterium]|nr:SH3 domain-containing protein [Chloroflexota bacterium]
MLKKLLPAAIALTLLLGAAIAFLPDGEAEGSRHTAPADCYDEPHLISRVQMTAETDVYAEDALDSNVIGTFEANELVTVIGRNRDGQWLVVEFDGNIVGWVQLNSVAIVACDNVNEPTNPEQPTAEPPATN